MPDAPTPPDVEARIQELDAMTGRDGLAHPLDAVYRDALRAALVDGAKLRTENTELREQFTQLEKDFDDASDAWDEKRKALAPHGDCACSYDQPGTLCAHHSPRLLAAQAEREAALRREAVLREALRWLVNIGCGVGKAGGSPEPGEFEAAIASGKAALTGGPRPEAEP